MNRLSYFSFLFIAMMSFSACHKDNSAPNRQTMIVGKWTLQKQAYTQYANTVKLIDTICLASNTAAATIQFNADKTFKSASLVILNNSGLGGSISEGGTNGTYTISSSSFTMSQVMAGLYFTASFGTVTDIPVISNITSTTQLVTLTTNSLQIHTEDGYTSTVDGVSTNYKNVDDFYYTK
jgi:hypothetical protein